MPKINSLEVVHQDTNTDSYQNLHDILVALNKSLALEKEVVDTDARVAIENLLEMYVNDKEAFLRSVLTLTAQFKNSEAIFSEEILLRASEIEALARKITSLSASLDNSNAALYEEINLRATADESFAQSIETLSATVGSKNRTYYQSTAPTTTGLIEGDLWIDSDDDKLYRWNGSSWVNIQDNQIGVNTAAITNESIARASGDSANASSINAVTARLDTGDFAAVKTESSVNASKVSGIEGRWGVTINVNGIMNGIQLLNGTNQQSDFIVSAQRFIVRDNVTSQNKIVWDAGTSKLKVDGDIYANAFYGNVVATGNINSNAVTVPVTTSTGGVNLATGPAIVSVTYVTLSNPGYIYGILSAGLAFPGGPSESFHELKINNTVVATAHSGVAYMQSVALSGALYLPAGTYDIQYVAWRTGAGTVQVESSTLYASGIKR